MKERTRLVLEWERRWDEGEGKVNISELCREFGITRECGYKWIKRFKAANFDVRAVEERSRRPKHSPTAIDEVRQELVVRARKAHPRWGPRKLRAWLEERYPGVEFPSASAIAEILKRRGLVFPRGRKPRRSVDAGVSPPFEECHAPNDVWCVDFKGWFRTKDGRKCYPLTITDAFSRFVLRCEAMLDPDGPGVAEVFDSAFREFGLPKTIRSDNGPPFASTGPAGLTRLSVWWLQLGIRLERIAPGKPQQNGQHERMHRTLKAETEIQRDARKQQEVFDLWRREFNEERPHEALGMKTPSKIYSRSWRAYPRKLIVADVTDWDRVEQVDKNGFIRLAKRKVFISSALKHLIVRLDRTDERSWTVYWGTILLGRIDGQKLERGLIPARRRRGQVAVLSLASEAELDDRVAR